MGAYIMLKTTCKFIFNHSILSYCSLDSALLFSLVSEFSHMYMRHELQFIVKLVMLCLQLRLSVVKNV